MDDINSLFDKKLDRLIEMHQEEIGLLKKLTADRCTCGKHRKKEKDKKKEKKRKKED